MSIRNFFNKVSIRAGLWFAQGENRKDYILQDAAHEVQSKIRRIVGSALLEKDLKVDVPVCVGREIVVTASPERQKRLRSLTEEFIKEFDQKGIAVSLGMMSGEKTKGGGRPAFIHAQIKPKKPSQPTSEL